MLNNNWAKLLKNFDCIELKGFQCEFGQGLEGVGLGPEFLRKASLVEILKGFNFKVNDSGDFHSDSLFKGLEYNSEAYLAQAARVYQQIAKESEELSRKGSFNLFLGGDHSISFGTVSGLLRTYPDLRVIWVDAHGDINKPEQSESQNLHGMPLAGLLGLIKKDSIPGMNWMKHFIKPENLVYIGVRDLDAGEIENIEKHDIKVFTATDVAKKGIPRIMENAIDYLNRNGEGPFHFSFDIDSVDPLFAPATGIHVENGLLPSDVNHIASVLAETRQLVSMELVEFNPFVAAEQEEINRSISILLGILTAVFSGKIIKNKNNSIHLSSSALTQ